MTTCPGLSDLIPRPPLLAQPPPATLASAPFLWWAGHATTSRCWLIPLPGKLPPPPYVYMVNSHTTFQSCLRHHLLCEASSCDSILYCRGSPNTQTPCWHFQPPLNLIYFSPWHLLPSNKTYLSGFVTGWLLLHDSGGFCFVLMVLRFLHVSQASVIGWVLNEQLFSEGIWAKQMCSLPSRSLQSTRVLTLFSPGCLLCSRPRWT